MRYVIARFPGMNLGWLRVGGPGLGNLLFVWARALVRATQTDADLVPPVWHQIKVGPLLRRERDLRTYVDVFPIRSANAVWAEWVRCRLTGRCVDRLDRAGSPEAGVTYEIVNDGRPCFHDLEPYRAEIRSALERAALPRARPRDDARPVIAVHVRLGDYAVGSGAAPRCQVNTRLPIDWYVLAVQRARASLGSRDAPAVVFSDGTDSELAALLAMKNVKRAPRLPSLTDILQMSGAEVLICSHSTFSLWAAFFASGTVMLHSGVPLNDYFTNEFLRNRCVRV